MSADQRATVFYCPFCGEESLFPQPEPAGAWRCCGCTKTFAVTVIRANQQQKGHV